MDREQSEQGRERRRRQGGQREGERAQRQPRNSKK
jgi:hypothetical protein